MYMYMIECQEPYMYMYILLSVGANYKLELHLVSHCQLIINLVSEHFTPLTLNPMYFM